MTKVTNLATLEEIEYTIPPRSAVIAAYAQRTCKDFNTWDYRKNYGHLVTVGERSVACGDWCALLEES